MEPERGGSSGCARLLGGGLCLLALFAAGCASFDGSRRAAPEVVPPPAPAMTNLVLPDLTLPTVEVGLEPLPPAGLPDTVVISPSKWQAFLDHTLAEPLGAGRASFYGKRFAGRKTANGERFNPRALTAAHRTLPFGARVRVTNIANGRSVIVRINDRGPFVGRRVIDLSRAAAEQLGMVRRGVARVHLELLPAID